MLWQVQRYEQEHTLWHLRCRLLSEVLLSAIQLSALHGLRWQIHRLLQEDFVWTPLERIRQRVPSFLPEFCRGAPIRI